MQLKINGTLYKDTILQTTFNLIGKHLSKSSNTSRRKKIFVKYQKVAQRYLLTISSRLGKTYLKTFY